MLSVSNTVSSWISTFIIFFLTSDVVCLQFYIGVVIRSVRQKYLILLYHARQTIPTPVIMQEKTSTWRKTRNYENNCHLLLSPSKLYFKLQWTTTTFRRQYQTFKFNAEKLPDFHLTDNYWYIYNKFVFLITKTITYCE